MDRNIPQKERIDFKNLLEQSPVATAVYSGDDMVVEYANTQMLHILNLDSSAIGKKITDVLSGPRGQLFSASIKETLQKGIEVYSNEQKIDVFINGSIQPQYYNFIYKPLKNSAGKIYAVLKTAIDLTQQVSTILNFKEFEDRAAFALSSSDIGTWDCDLLNGAVFFNDYSRELFGLPSTGHFSIEEIDNYLNPNDLIRVKETISMAMNPENSGVYEVTFRIFNGLHQKTRWVRSKGRGYFNADGVAHRLAGIFIDITDQLKINEEQSKLMFLIDNSSEAITLSDWDGTITFLNKAGQDMFGFKNLEEANRHQTEFIMPGELQKLRENINPGLVRDGKWSGEVLYQHFITKEPIPAFANALLIRNPIDGEPLGRASLIHDLRAEKAAMAEQNKLLALVENSTDYMAVSTIDGKLIYINRAGRRLVGLDPDMDLSNLHAKDFYTDKDWVYFNEVIMPGLIKNGRCQTPIYLKHFLTHENIPCHASFIPIYDPVTNNLIGRGVTIRDLRPELAAKRALQQNEKMFRGITTASPAALWMTDKRMKFTYINQIFSDWTGNSLEDDLFNYGWLNAIHPEDKDKTLRSFLEASQTHAYYERQFRILHQDHTVRWIICTGNPQYDDSGKFSGYIGACLDITELKHLQSQKDEFIGIASHELKTPVTSIKAYAQILEATFRQEGDHKRADMLLKMDIQISRLTTLIADLLDVTKMHTGKLQFNDRRFDFNEMITEVTEELQRTTTKHTIIQKLDETGTVYADRERISQVITNLLSNAIKYSPNADKIIISSAIEEGYVLVKVHDFGIGISKDKQEKVFEQFYRVSGDKHHTFPGLGLGLYISSEIIKREGGKMWVESKENEGSTFCFSLPANLGRQIELNENI